MSKLESKTALSLGSKSNLPTGLKSKKNINPYPVDLTPKEHMIIETKRDEMQKLKKEASGSSRKIKKVDVIRVAIAMVAKTDSKTLLKAYRETLWTPI